MSGSSLDGIDLAYYHLEEEDGRIAWHLLSADTIQFPENLLSSIKSWASLDALSYIQLENDFTTYLVNALNDFIANNCEALDLIVSHGHTLLHIPDQTVSIQIGKGGVLATKTGYPVLCDLRIQDVAQGGQGAPLAALVDQHLFSQYTYSLNLGGIANITMQSEDGYKAFDICAANQVLNHLARLKGYAYDDKGKMARSGERIELVSSNLDHGFYKKSAPKSLDNNWVMEEVIQKLPEARMEDLLHSYCHFIADQIKFSILSEDNNYEGKTMLVAGGGTRNDFLVECIRGALSEIGIFVYEANDDVIDYKECLLMALMGFLFLNEKHNILSEVTGGSHDLMAGAFYQGSKFPYIWTKHKG